MEKPVCYEGGVGKQADPHYHYTEIMAALKSAAAKMPRVDAVGGSSAGIIIDNRPMVASLFRSVLPERFHEVRSLFLRIGEELGVPLVVIDGDVTAWPAQCRWKTTESWVSPWDRAKRQVMWIFTVTS
jgi:hypothetical protein